MVAQIAMEQLNRNPKVQWITFQAPDAYHHINGLNPTYDSLLIHIDGLIGDIYQKSLAKNQEDRMFCIVSDHGAAEVNANIDLTQMINEDLGLKIERGKSTELSRTTLDDSISEWEDKDGLFVINGNLSAYLYLKGDDWKVKQRKKQLENYSGLNIIDYLSKASGVGLIAYQVDESTVEIRNGQAIAQIEKLGELYKYKLLAKDPLGYEDVVYDEYFSKDILLNKTINSNYPDAIFRLFELVINEKSGDIVICSAPNYDLAKNYELFVGNYKGGHGALRRELLNVPYILFGRNIPSVKIPFARSEDIGATIGNLLNFAPAYNLDGRDLLEKEPM